VTNEEARIELERRAACSTLAGELLGDRPTLALLREALEAYDFQCSILRAWRAAVDGSPADGVTAWRYVADRAPAGLTARARDRLQHATVRELLTEANYEVSVLNIHRGGLPSAINSGRYALTGYMARGVLKWSEGEYDFSVAQAAARLFAVTLKPVEEAQVLRVIDHATESLYERIRQMRTVQLEEEPDFSLEEELRGRSLTTR
jgi:hypothetical protein